MMAQYPEKPTLPPYLADAMAKQARQLMFRKLHGTFRTQNSGGSPVDVFKVSDSWGSVAALLFRTTLNEDLDGAPNSYAPPVSATNLSPKGGVVALDHIKNAT